MAKSSGIGVLLGVGLLYFLFSKKKPSSGNGNGNGIPFVGPLPDEDPLAEDYSAKSTSFVSKGTGIVSPGSYTHPFVRRNGTLKPVSKAFKIARKAGQEVYAI